MKEPRLRIAGANGEWLVWAKLAELKEAWQKPLRGEVKKFLASSFFANWLAQHVFQLAEVVLRPVEAYTEHDTREAIRGRRAVVPIGVVLGNPPPRVPTLFR